MKKILPALLIVLSLITCGKKEMSIKKYYFPYVSFIKPQVYKYVDKKNTNSIMYWHFKTNIEKGDTLLTTSVFDTNYKLRNMFQNLISKTGCNLKEVLINIGDSTDIKKFKVLKSEVFNWHIKSDKKLITSFSISNSKGKENENVVTERSFKLKKEYKIFNGNEYECIVANDLVILNHIKQNKTISEEQHRTSIFAEGIGLIEIETFNADGSSSYFILEKIISENDFNLSIKNRASTPDSSGTTVF